MLISFTAHLTAFTQLPGNLLRTGTNYHLKVYGESIFRSTEELSITFKQSLLREKVTTNKN